MSRFHNPYREPSLNYEVILAVDDDVQLSVTQYRNKVYEVYINFFIYFHVKCAKKHKCCVSVGAMIFEQMILEKRATRQMASKAHLKQKAEEKPGREVGDNGQDKALSKDKECKKAEREEGGEGDGGKKNNKDQPGAGSDTAKPVSIQNPTLIAGKSRPAANACMTKASYNPITHVLSKSCFTEQLVYKTILRINLKAI